MAGAGEVGDELAAALLGHPGAPGELGDVDALGRDRREDAHVGHPQVAHGAVGQLRADPPEQAGHQLRQDVVPAVVINALYYLGVAARLGPVSAHVASVNLGSREPSPAKDVGVTGIRKRAVEVATLRAPGPKRGGLGSGLVGDFIGDVRHHGGDLQAVYAFAREELDLWERRLGVELPTVVRREPHDARPRRRRVAGRRPVGGRRPGGARGDRPAHPVCDLRGPDGHPGLGEDVRGRRREAAPTSQSSPAARCGPATRYGVSSRPEHDVDVPDHVPGVHGRPRRRGARAGRRLPARARAGGTARDGRSGAGERCLTHRRPLPWQVVKSLSHLQLGELMHDRTVLGPADVDDATLTSMVATLLGADTAAVTRRGVARRGVPLRPARDHDGGALRGRAARPWSTVSGRRTSCS